MRKFLISLMAASMLVPAAAQAQDGGFVRGMRNQAERTSSRDNDDDRRSSRSQSGERSKRSDDNRPARVERSQRVERGNGGRSDVQRVERVRRADRQVRQVAPAQVDRQQRVQRTERRDGLVGGFTRVARDDNDGRTYDRNNDRDWRRDGNRDNDRNWSRDRDGHRWSRDWRRDRRYDWSNYRTRYASLFRLGRYYDPYGYNYRRFSIGFSLSPNYYGSNYWLNDPWMYRLPPAYGPYRWVRYYDDALMVNIYSGQVVDVIHNFFW